MSIKLHHLLLLVALISSIFAAHYFWQRYAPVPHPLPVPQSDSHLPQSVYSLQLPASRINLLVYPAAYTAGKWDYTSQGVSYLTATPLPGNPGNSVFYGHNWPNLLGSLKNAQIGDKLIFTFNDNLRREFSITSIETVSADDLNILAPTADTRVTLYTCTGFLDLKRLVLVAAPSGQN